MKLMGMSEEERLEFEQATGIKTEDIQRAAGSLHQTEEILNRALREVQEVIGPHGSISRVQAGGVKIARGTGIGVFSGGIKKTTIDTEGNLFVGSDIEGASTTSLSVFVVDQIYQGEELGAGDLLIGDNTSANVLYDASETQLQFREGSTVQVYVDTDGTLKAGAGGVTLSVEGIVLTNVSGVITFLTAAGAEGAFIFNQNTDDLAIQNNIAGKAINLTATTTDLSAAVLSLKEDNSNDNVSHLDLSIATSGAKISIGGEVEIWAEKDGEETIFNAGGNNVNFRVNYADGTAALLIDADNGTTTIGGVLVGPLAAETDSADVFRCNSCGASTFSGTINGTPSGTSVVYNAGFSGNENALVAANTNQLAKMRLYNTTRGTSALISTCNTGTNTITLTATAPAAWANGDTITIASQTVTGGGFNWVDLLITSGPLSKSSLFFNLQVSDTTNTNVGLRLHPTTTFGSSKIGKVLVQVVNVTNDNMVLIPITGNVFSASWDPAGAASMSVTIREAGYIT